MNWYDDLCEYYGVSPQEAIRLGTRRNGRKPNLPGSKTCSSVSGKTFEELWGEKPRDTIQQKMDFYKDIGSWQVFRQCNYRRNFNYEGFLFSYLRNNSSIVEYGCGVAPFVNYIVEKYIILGKIYDIKTMKFSLVDVCGEHLEFAKWRIKKKIPFIDLDIHEINSEYIVPNFIGKFDIICIMDVFEHLPNPYDVMINLEKHSSVGTIMVETWIDKSNGRATGPNLSEAQEQRDVTIKFIQSKFDIVKNGDIRIYRKR